MNNQLRTEGKSCFKIQYGKWSITKDNQYRWDIDYAFDFFGSYLELEKEIEQLNQLLNSRGHSCLRIWENSGYYGKSGFNYRAYLGSVWYELELSNGEDINQYILPQGRRFDKYAYRYQSAPLSNPVWNL